MNSLKATFMANLSLSWLSINLLSSTIKNIFPLFIYSKSLNKLKGLYSFKKWSNPWFSISMKILMKLRNILPIENGLFKISTKQSGLNTLNTTFIILELKRIKMAYASTATVYWYMMVMCKLLPTIKLVFLLDLELILVTNFILKNGAWFDLSYLFNYIVFVIVI